MAELNFEMPVGENALINGGGDEDDEPGFRLLPYDSDSDLTDEGESDEDEDQLTEKEKKAKKKEKKRKRRAKRLIKEKERAERDTQPIPSYECTRVKEWSVDTATIKLRMLKGAEACEGTPIVEGFPSKGLTSVLVAKFLITELALPLVGEIASDAFPPMCRITHRFSGLPVRVYGDKRMTVFLSEMQPHGVLAHAMADVVFYWAKEFKSSLIITAESLAKEIKLKEDVEVTEDNIMELLAKGMEEHKKTVEKEKKRRNSAKEKHAKKKLTHPGKHPKLKVGGKKSGGDKVASLKEGAKKDDDAQSDATSEGWEDVDDDEDIDDDKDTSAHGSDSESEDSDVEDNDVIMYFTSDNRVAKYLRDSGLRQVREGIVNGVTGVIMAEAFVHDVPTLCLVGRYNPMLTDTRVSVDITRQVIDLLNTQRGDGEELSIDFEHLESRAGKVENKMRKSIKQVTKATMSKKKAPGMMYM